MNYKEFFLENNKSGFKCKEQYLVKNQPELYEKIITHCENIETNNFTEKIWYFINHVNKEHKCKCGNKTKFDTLKLGFREYCGNKCPEKSKDIAEKRKNTLIERYGSDNPMKIKEFNDKAKNTIKNKYGVDNISQIDSVKNLKVKKSIEKYGVDNVSKSEEIKSKIKETNLERYGTEFSLQSPEIRNKIINTNIERYGGISPFSSDEVKNKIKETNLERYGDISPIKNVNVREKRDNTNIERYGGISPFSSDEVKLKTNETNLERYGDISPIKNVNVREKRDNTNIERYGTLSPLNNVNIRDKINKTNLERYGVDNPIKTNEIRAKINKIIFDKYGVDNVSKLPFIKTKIKDTLLNKLIKKTPHYDFINEDENNLLFKCDLGHEFQIEKSLYHQRSRFNNTICTKCNPVGVHQISSYELEIRKFLDDNNIEYITNDRNVIKPLEIDIYIPSKNIGIEINGIYWHSDKFINPDYHISKTRFGFLNHVKIIHIFEDEFINKKDIVFSRLSNILKINDEKIYARKCVVKEIDTRVSTNFLDENHIQGNVGGKIKYGLFYNDELVSVMTFGSLRKNLGSISKDKSFELLRFCNKKGVNVIGGASKLFKHFIKNNDFNEIISYADVRYSSIIPGETIYSKLGFEYVHLTKPNYYYVKNNKRYNRFTFRKSELIKKGFDPNKTEKEIMVENGYNRIYDCGNHKFIFKK